MERKIKSFEDLEVWKFCRELRNKLAKLAKNLPGEEEFRLADQIIRAARSLTNNLAEGYGRFHYKENIQFCRQSRGSLYELIDHLIICLDEEYINNEQFTKYRDDCIRGMNLVRFAHNWNVGILECWNNGFWGNGILGYRQNSLLTAKLIKEYLSFNINIPTFHYSMYEA